MLHRRAPSPGTGLWLVALIGLALGAGSRGDAEDEWDDEVTAYLEGPIRVIRQERNRLTFAGIEIVPTLLVDAMYFPDFHLAPVQVDQTIHFPSIAREAWFKLAMDWNESAKGMRYDRPRPGAAPGAADAWHTIDGVTTPGERKLDDQNPDWHLVTGAPGTFLWWVEMPPPLVPVTHLTYTDDAATADPPRASLARWARSPTHSTSFRSRRARTTCASSTCSRPIGSRARRNRGST